VQALLTPKRPNWLKHNSQEYKLPMLINSTTQYKSTCAPVNYVTSLMYSNSLYDILSSECHAAFICEKWHLVGVFPTLWTKQYQNERLIEALIGYQVPSHRVHVQNVWTSYWVCICDVGLSYQSQVIQSARRLLVHWDARFFPWALWFLLLWRCRCF